MAYKKIIIAVDCDTEQEQQLVQAIAQEISETFKPKAKDLISFYPTLQKHKGLLYTAVKTISQEGKKGIFKLVPMLLKQI
jgi:hypothetical protein